MNKRITFKLEALLIPLIIFISFWIVAVILWQSTGSIFYLFNFGYIGTAVGIGIGLYMVFPKKQKPLGRRIAQLLVGIYMLGFLGVFKMENMQIEGFFFYALSGFFSGSLIHYLVAKIFGPVLYGRAYCGWACWTTMILDFLPFKQNKKGRIAAKWEFLRYAHFGISLLLVLILWFLFEYRIPVGKTALIWLIAGNLFYFIASIILAFALKDNRAFCKYLCPIPVIQKITARFSLLKIEGDKSKCTQCGTCNNACPMDINIMDYVNNDKRVLSTECIFCTTCTTVCPNGALDETFRMDIGGKELIKRR